MKKCILMAVLLACIVVGGIVVMAQINAKKAQSALDNDLGTLTYTVSEDGETVEISYLLNGERVFYTVPNKSNYTSGGLAGTDDLGRALHTSNQVGLYGSKGERYVGLFYFLWHGEHGDSGVYDLQKNIDELGVETAGSLSASGSRYGSTGVMHWFAQPLYGYYYASDEWVIRKHMEELTNANIDFLYFDVTNGYAYIDNALKVMEICHQLNEQGFDAPQVVFYIHTQSAKVVKELYDTIYSKGVFADTWFRIDGKPVIITPYEDNIDDFFCIKREQWPNQATNDNAWPWMDFQWPQRLFSGNDGRNAVSVSIAQHSGNTVFSSSALYGYTGNRGRSFCDGYTGEQAHALAAQDPTLSYKGLNFQNQFDYAIESNATYVLVTGWNEWVAQRQAPDILGGKDKVVFIDTASVEYSRDAEMMCGGYFDNYYMQLAANVQRLKGTAPIILQDSRHKIDIAGSFEQWDEIKVAYADLQGDIAPRISVGFGYTPYINKTGRNDIVCAKITNDTKNMYFFVETAKDITEFDNDSSWMQLFLDTDSDSKTGWYGYDYIVNYSAKSANLTAVAKYVGTDGELAFEECGEVSYRVEGNKMMLAVPQSMLGIEENHYRELCMQFKWADSETVISTMEQFYIDGDCAPIGRMNFVYQNYIPGVSEVVYPELGQQK